MDKQLKEKWIEALESGKYRKATGGLRKKLNKAYGYCCLGVLCDIATNDEWKKNQQETNFYSKGSNSNLIGILSIELRRNTGLSNESHSVLTNLNDNNKGWKKVIEYIKENL